MKCKKCKAEDWYVKGKYRRCIPCHNRTQLASYHNRKLGIERQSRTTNKSRPLAEQLKMFSQKKVQTHCSKGHPYQDNTRLEIDKQGRVHRRCLSCQALRDKRRYGVQPPSPLATLLGESKAPLDRLGDL